MVIRAISYPGERLGLSGQAFVMDRIGMHTLRLSLHSEYKQVRHKQAHPLKPTILFSIKTENCAVASISLSLLQSWTSAYCFTAPSHTHTDTPSILLMWRYDDAFRTYSMLTKASDQCD